MRKILFRGKAKQGGEWVREDLIHVGEWVQGDLLQTNYSDGRKHWSIFEETPTALNVRVTPETVGQYTGLCDKNGVKVFEDDLIMIDDGLWKKPRRVMWIPDRFGFYVCTEGGSGEPLFPQIREYGEVVGNIFDTPEKWKMKHDKMSKIVWHEVFNKERPE